MTKKKQSAGANTKQSPQKNIKKSDIKQIANEMKQMMVNDVNVASKRKARTRTKGSNFGAVSSITTAPVAIGNSVRGSAKQISKTAKGVTISGRDFMFAPTGTATAVNDWCLVGGTALTPAAFADSVISNYQRMYMKFRFRSFVVHYITSSPTSASGDVLFYYGKDRQSVFINQTSNQLLPFVFTDQNTVMGPQWTNHSAKFTITGDWKLTDYGMHSGLEEYADGEVFLLSKTSTSDSPGYVIFDYVVEFAEESFQPRLLTFPIPRIQWTDTCVGLDAVAVTVGTTCLYATIKGKLLDGTTATSGAFASAVRVGDVYKVIFDVTNSTTNTGNAAWTACTAANLVETDIMATQTALTLTDGFTCYAVSTATQLAFYQNAEAAFASACGTQSLANQVGAIRYGVTATITYSLIMWASYIGTVTTANNTPNF